ncbi:ADP-ribosylglycohydrolase family protein [Kitasatospora paracochleata]|uniref:ADP-ribosylglycohydrolase n=1 Tax=Kitasatospora paracochleata TaxID=58354 RepID=A0ABT1IXV8_9ACTN|nr:ADP-ribosylglycohydrolase family protein [Kitasatospora paracochleata]MCP2309779.1 ADP-ribosylglycohydrolase [Kitasatospora paracochleata]
MGHATGAMLGLAIGDALGKPVEFATYDELLRGTPDWRLLPLPKNALVTDDTQMTLALARALRDAMDDGPLVPLRLQLPLREEFVEWWRSPENNRAPGMTCMRACWRLSMPDRLWQDASDIGSKGCGANMRVAPLGLVDELTDRRLSGAAQLQSALTHGHPTALAASELTAFTVRWLAAGVEPRELPALLRAHAHANRTRYDAFWLGDLAARAHDHSPEEFIARGWDECLAVLDRLDAALARPTPDRDPCEITGAGWIAEDAFATALLCFLLLPDDPVAAVRRAAYSSGDSDSIACLTGAFAGARHGEVAWPADWVERIEHRDELLAFGRLWDRPLTPERSATPAG